jgi:hypothetical protein
MRSQLVSVPVRVLSTAVTLVLLGGLTACGGDTPTPAPRPTNSTSPQSSGSSPSATPTSTRSPSASESARNDFAELPLRRSIDASALRVVLEYNTRLPVEEWQPRSPKPIRVSLSAANRRNRNQNVYLLRTTAEVTVIGENGFVERPPAVIDVANIVPGFIVKPPSTYNQVFNLPGVDDAATSMTIDFTFEFVVQVSAQREFGDYAKQVASDTVVVPIAR